MIADVFIHASGICETQNVGAGTRIWAFAHILSGARIGSNCNICDNVFIEGDVVLGDRVTVQCGAQIRDGAIIEDDVFIGPAATFTNDPFPRSKITRDGPLQTIIRLGASIGANATILPGIEVGRGAMIGAGAVVTHSVPPNAIVKGNPARITGYVQALPTVEDDNGRATATFSDIREQSPSSTPLGVGGCVLHRLRFVEDMRGNLSAGDFLREIPFVPKRFFLITDVRSPEVRGERAHRLCHRFLVCIKGSCRVLLDDGRYRREIRLDQPHLGIYVPPRIWETQHSYSSEATLLVFASEYYDPDDYVRNYDEFCSSFEKQRER
jgi:acetyltransferase-like isoleucine patch superfamily enzyme